jgi:hypothetical protein
MILNIEGAKVCAKNFGDQETTQLNAKPFPSQQAKTGVFLANGDVLQVCVCVGCFLPLFTNPLRLTHLIFRLGARNFGMKPAQKEAGRILGKR